MSEGYWGAKLGLAMLRSAFPTDRMPELIRGREAVEWLSRAQRINLVLIVAFLPEVIVAGAAVTLVMLRIAAWGHGLRTPAVLEATAPWIVYAIPGLFFGIILSGVLVAAILRLWLGAEGYRKYEWASSAIAEYDARRASRWVVPIMLGLSVVLGVLFFDWHVRVTPHHVQRSSFLTLGAESRPLADVAHVYLVTRSTRNAGYEYLVFDFSDGERWEMADLFSFPEHDAGTWARRLRDERGLVVTILEREDDLPPPRAGGGG